MRYRRFGRTGVHVGNPSLGAMMFGQWGNPDHDESIAVIHAAPDVDVLDRLDEIVPPGTNFTWADAGYSPPMIGDPRARRRP